MTVRLYLSGSVAVAVISSIIWLLIIMQLDPAQAGVIGLLLLFLSLFLAVGSITNVVGYGLRRLLVPRQFPSYRVRTSLRQGVVLGLFTSVLLLLQLLRFYHWWLTLILIVLFVSIEFIFLTYDRASGRHLRTTETASN